MKQSRILTPREKNYLLKYGGRNLIDKIDDYGEMPVEYITEIAEFGDLVLRVNRDVLIPRVETERLVEICLDEISKLNLAKVIIADVGTGSGAIGLSLLDYLVGQKRQGQLIMSDVSMKALSVAKRNFKKVSKDRNWPDNTNKQVVFLQSDLLANYPSNLSFHLIVANLPYIPNKRIQKLDNSVKDYEPLLALKGGANGDQIIKKLLEQAKNYLKKDGLIILEVDDDSNVLSWPDDYKYDIIKDQFNKQRFVKARLRLK